jgi:hypothetical protein
VLGLGNDPGMGFNRRRMEAERKAKADAEVAARRAADSQVLADAERLIAAWNERQARRMPLLFAPTIERSRLGTTSCGSIAPPAAPRETLTCARSTATVTLQSRA